MTLVNELHSFGIKFSFSAIVNNINLTEYLLEHKKTNTKLIFSDSCVTIFYYFSVLLYVDNNVSNYIQSNKKEC